jgi:hypothetical protein
MAEFLYMVDHVNIPTAGARGLSPNYGDPVLEKRMYSWHARDDYEEVGLRHAPMYTRDVIV